MHDETHISEVSPLGSILRGAETLEERLARQADFLGTAASESPYNQIKPRMAIWAQAASGGDRKAFLRRLSWDGIEPDLLPVLLREEGGPSPVKEPPWARFLPALLQSSEEELPTDAHRSAAAFPELYAVLIASARRELSERISPSILLSLEACRSLEGSLLSQLAKLGETVVYQEFATFRNLQNGDWEEHSNSRANYNAFLDSFRRGRQKEFFFEYPALARLLCLTAETWVETSAEFIARLAADRESIAALFSPGTPLGEVVSISPNLSDRHCGGRQVMALQFTSGLRLVYKPKDIALERSFHEFLRWLGNHGLEDAPPALRVLDRGGAYGWVEFATQQDVPSVGQVKAYYRKAGALLCVIHALDGSDCHMENIIATNAGPVLIDGEALLQPTLATDRPENSGDTFIQARHRLRHSVLRTGLLPQLQRGPSGGVHDVSGLGGRGGYPSASKERFWRHLNTDAMAPEQRERVAAECENVLRLGDDAQSPAEFVGEIVTGFETAYRFLMEHREAILSGPIAALSGLQSRLILRPSSTYGSLLAKSVEPAALRSGIDRSIVLEPLCRAFARATTTPARWPLIRRERAALEALDIPFFSASTSSRDLDPGDGIVLPGLLAQASYDQVSQRIRLMNEEDLRQQTEWIRASFHRGGPVVESSRRLTDGQIDQWLASVPAVSNQALVAEAKRLADDLAAHAVHGEDHLATWLTPASAQPGASAGEGAPYYLYDGTSGIVLFLAAFQSVTGSTEYHDLIQAACRPMTAIANHPEAAQWLGRESIGAACGLGSVVYALTGIAQFIGDAALLETAGKIARFISPAQIAADRRFDLLEGSAGAIVALLALHAVTGEADLVDRAAQCGRHLLDTAIKDSANGWAWPAFPDGALLGGLAHGAAGIAYALSRLHAATGAEEFSEGAREAIRFERTLFDPATGNWPIMPPPKSIALGARPITASAWCHGAPGIAFGRIGTLDSIADDSILQEIDVALDTTIRSGLAQIDHLCCGNFGRIDLALTAALRLGRPRLTQVARAGAVMALHRARIKGRYTLQADPEKDACFQPGFFRGTSGIGYTLLRLAFPGKLPSVLLWEPVPTSSAIPQPTNDSMNAPTTPSTATGVTFRKVSQGDALLLEKMTFPAYRPLLHRDPPKTLVVAVAAFSGAEPIGMALSGLRGEEAELLSLFVSTDHRGRGVGRTLLAALEKELRNAGAIKVVTTYMTGKPGSEAFQKVLAAQAWEPPITRMLVVHSTSELSKKSPWRRHANLPPNYELLLWNEVTPEEREEIRQSQERNHWIPDDLVPFRHEKECDLRTSVALRKDGRIVGWLITHLLWGDTVRFTCNFVREDLQRRGRLFWLYGETCRRAEALGISKGQGTAPLIHPAMAAFAKRWMEPYASFFGETRGSQKLLA